MLLTGTEQRIEWLERTFGDQRATRQEKLQAEIIEWIDAHRTRDEIVAFEMSGQSLTIEGWIEFLSGFERVSEIANWDASVNDPGFWRAHYPVIQYVLSKLTDDELCAMTAVVQQEIAEMDPHASQGRWQRLQVLETRCDALDYGDR
jgi:hypothetical protein